MAFETIWFTFQIEFFDAETMVDKIPADDEREARATIQRIYPEARVVRLLSTERKENYFARFDPSTANRPLASNASSRAGPSGAKAAPKPPPEEASSLTFSCPECQHRILTAQRLETAIEHCPRCGWRYENRPIHHSLTVIAPLPAKESARRPESPPPAAATRPAGAPSSGHPTGGYPAATPWHQILEVAPEADLRTVRTAYLNLIRLYHPDKVSHLGPDLLRFAENRTAALNAALQGALKTLRP